MGTIFLRRVVIFYKSTTHYSQFISTILLVLTPPPLIVFVPSRLLTENIHTSVEEEEEGEEEKLKISCKNGASFCDTCKAAKALRISTFFIYSSSLKFSSNLQSLLTSRPTLAPFQFREISLQSRFQALCALTRSFRDPLRRKIRRLRYLLSLHRPSSRARCVSKNFPVAQFKFNPSVHLLPFKQLLRSDCSSPTKFMNYFDFNPSRIR